MCGIATIINYEKEPLSMDCVEYIFKNLEARGDNASGIYYERLQGQIANESCSRLFKGPYSATTLWNNLQKESDKIGLPQEFKKRWRLDGTERLIMMHTRYATKGPVGINHNNMPIFSKRWVLVHNGCLTADKVEGYDYKGTVDSEELLAQIESTNSMQDAIAKAKGSMAIIARPLLEDSLYLYRNTNPLSIVLSRSKKFVFVCSKPEFVLNEEDVALLEAKDDPFTNGSITIDLTPYVLYRLDLKEPELEAVANYKITGEWAKGEPDKSSGWDYSRWEKDYDGLED